MQGGSIRERFVAGAFWSVAASLASQIPSLLVSVLLGRILGVTSFGELAMVQATVIFISGVGDLGLNLAVTRHVAVQRGENLQKSGQLIGFAMASTLVSGVALAVILVCTAGWYAREILRAPQLSLLLQCSAALLIFEMLNKIQISILAGLESFRGAAKVNAFRGCFLLLVPMAAFFGKTGGSILFLTLASLATCLAAQYVLRAALQAHQIRIQWNLRLAESGVAQLAGSLWFSLLAINFAGWAASVMLVRQPSGMAEMAVYTAAEKWKTALMFLPGVLVQVTTPLIANTHSSGNRNTCGRILAASSAVSGGATLLMGLAMLVFAPSLMSAYGWKQNNSVAVLVVTCLGCVPIALYSQGSAALWTLGKPAKMLSIDILKVALLLILLFAGFDRSALLLAWANGLSIAGAGLVLVLILRNNMRLERSKSNP